MANNSSTATVLLPTVSKSSLSSSGATTGETNFKLTVSGCPSTATATNLAVRFVGNNASAEGYINNTGSAANVKLVVSSISNGPVLPISNWTSTVDADGITLPANATTAERDYYVRYIATGPANAGSVLGSLQYAMIYP